MCRGCGLPCWMRRGVEGEACCGGCGVTAERMVCMWWWGGERWRGASGGGVARKWPTGAVGSCGAVSPSAAVIELSLCQPNQRVADLAVDLDAFLRQARARSVAALAGDADFRDALLAWRGLDRLDPP